MIVKELIYSRETIVPVLSREGLLPEIGNQDELIQHHHHGSWIETILVETRGWEELLVLVRQHLGLGSGAPWSTDSRSMFDEEVRGALA